MGFPLDGTFEPVAVALRERQGVLEGEVAGTADVEAARRQVARVFSLDVDATSYPEVGRREPAVGRLMARFEGLRPLLFTSPYECAAWAVMSQRISMRQAAVIQGRLVEADGRRLEVAGGPAWAFPSPERLVEVAEVPGLAAVKVDRLRAVARAALAGLLDPYRLRELGPEDGPASVRAIPGIGPFWAAGIYLRAAGVTDVFPEEPRSIEALARLRGLTPEMAHHQLTGLTEIYRPWRMWVCVLLRFASGRGAFA
jgi:DNA-3-methyladenine glycosylase II